MVVIILMAVSGLSILGLSISGLTVFGLSISSLTVIGLSISRLSISRLSISILSISGFTVLVISVSGTVTSVSRFSIRVVKWRLVLVGFTQVNVWFDGINYVWTIGTMWSVALSGFGLI